MNSGKNKFELKNLILELTNQCNLRCKMCGIWAEKDKKNLSISHIKKIIFSDIFQHPILSVSLTGGECFMHPDFNSIFKLLTLARLKKIINRLNITTNGYLTDKILSFLSDNQKATMDLNMGFSIDGTEINHNTQRGIKDAHTKTLNTINQIKSKFPQIIINIKFTINNFNYKDIPKIFGYCMQNHIKLELKLIETNNPYYYHRLKIKQGIFHFTNKQKQEISYILSSLIQHDRKNRFPIIEENYISKLISFLSGRLVWDACYTPTFSLFITYDGGVHPCIYYPPITNVNNPKWEEEILNVNHKKIINEGLNKECPKCLAYHGYLKKWNFT